MTTLEIILLILSALLLALCVVPIIKYNKTHKSVETLSDEIEEYLKSGKKIHFDTADNSFSRLHNDISDLCDTLDLQRQNNQKDSIKNAQFVADVSHQLKTPLAGIRLYCEMNEAHNPTENGEKQLKLLDKTEQLVYNLLRLQKLKADAYEMNFTDNKIENIIEDTTEQFKALYPEKQIDIIGCAALRCDSEWLSEAFGNIIKNACEHTENDGRIRIKIEPSESSVSVSFEDNGGGANVKDLPNLFNRFYRSENADPNSTGLGLAITKEIVEKHHGIVSVENTADGLKITMCFPVIDGIRKSE